MVGITTGGNEPMRNEKNQRRRRSSLKFHAKEPSSLKLIDLEQISTNKRPFDQVMLILTKLPYPN